MIKNYYLSFFITVFFIFICEFSLAMINYIKYQKLEKLYAHDWKEILKTQNIEEYIAPKNFLSLKTNPQTIFPLSQASNKRILSCNKNEVFSYSKIFNEWLIIDTDRYGFNNLDSSWDQDVDFVVIGDSFTYGICVKTEDNFVSNLSSFSNLNGINLGQSGNGPLLSFAALKEFGIATNPQKVIHLIYENDIKDLDNEMKNSFLTETYLNNDKLQNLLLKQNEVDDLLLNAPKFNIDYIFKERVESYKNIRKQILKKIWKLGNLRERFSLVRKTKFEQDYSKVFNLLKKINIYLKNKNIEYFIVIVTNPRNKTKIEQKKLAKFISKISEEDIKYINTNEVFNDLEIKEYLRGHYNELGYKILAKKFYEKFQIDK